MTITDEIELGALQTHNRLVLWMFLQPTPRKLISLYELGRGNSQEAMMSFLKELHDYHRSETIWQVCQKEK